MLLEKTGVNMQGSNILENLNPFYGFLKLDKSPLDVSASDRGAMMLGISSNTVGLDAQANLQAASLDLCYDVEHGLPSHCIQVSTQPAKYQ